MLLNFSGNDRVFGRGGPFDVKASCGGSERFRGAGRRNTWFLHGFRVGLYAFTCTDGSSQIFSDDYGETSQEGFCEALFVIAGTLRMCVMNGECCEHYRVPAGRCNVRYFPLGSRSLDCLPEDRAVILRIEFAAPELLGSGRLRREIDEAVQNVCLLNVDVPMNPQMERIIFRLRETAERDLNAAPLAMSGALELLWHVARSRESVSLSVAELENSAVDTARRILESRLENPPSIEELAARVGMSISKFKQVFTRNCGKPPYAYLREVRLERAMCLLRCKGMRVTQAAMEVGYNNLSYFAKAFEARFGIKPSRARGGK